MVGGGTTQSPQPEAQVGLQTPPVQLVAVALVVLQTRPQAPQFILSLARMRGSQPLAGLPSQSATPALQVKAQRPAEQPMLVAFTTDVVQLMAAPHEVPQLVAEFMLTSQPFDATPSQLP